MSESNPRTLSVLLPCFNERGTILQVLHRIAEVRLPGLTLELIVIDDGSQDGSGAVAETYAKEHPAVRVVRHPQNRGKGAAIRTGIAAASGEFVLIQDTDLEYDPTDYSKLLQPLIDGRADVVYGSRFIGGESHRVLYYWHSVMNRLLTNLSNMVTNLNLTDMEIGYKAFRRDILARIRLQEDRFGFEPEITAKLSKLRPFPRIYEVGVSYSGRTYEEGKKITWRDGVRAIYCILRYGLFS